MNSKLFTEIENFLEKEKCDELIKICEEKNDKSIYNFSNQFRIKFIDIIIQEMIQKIYNEKIKLILNSDFHINDTFSYVRYYNDGLVESHYDKYINKAQFSILIYLNDEYDYGETYIYNENHTKIITIPKKTGKCIIFDGSKLLHGCNQVKGIKNILIGSLIKI